MKSNKNEHLIHVKWKDGEIVFRFVCLFVSVCCINLDGSVIILSNVQCFTDGQLQRSDFWLRFRRLASVKAWCESLVSCHTRCFSEDLSLHLGPSSQTEDVQQRVVARFTS